MVLPYTVHRDAVTESTAGSSCAHRTATADLFIHNISPLQTFPPKLVLLDFGDMDSMPEAEILDCYGCLDILIFNSSMKVKAPAQSLSLEVDKLLMDNNYFGPVTLAKGVLPSMISRRSGHLLLVHSIQGRLTVPFGTTYAASKHAVQAAFDCPRAEVEEDGISVSTVNESGVQAHLLSLKISSVISSPCLLAAVLYTTKPLGVSPDEAATEIVKTLNNKRKEVVIAPSLPKVAIYARSFFPNMFFLVMAAGVKHAAPSEKI
uniref:Dehydrogenase/reductase 7C n=1 Tax=Amphilophus citrinellus TaxID=61819 RepID=A0A3Q0QVY3_AMPCI